MNGYSRRDRDKRARRLFLPFSAHPGLRSARLEMWTAAALRNCALAQGAMRGNICRRRRALTLGTERLGRVVVHCKSGRL